RFSDLRNYFTAMRPPLTLLNMPPPSLDHITLVPFNMSQVPGQIPLSFVPNIGQAAGTAITREHRRLYVGHISTDVTKNMLVQFFNQQLFILGLGPIVDCQLFSGKKFAFLEFRSADETTGAMVLDGINFMGNNLKIRRPDNYQSTSTQSDHILNYVNPESPNAIYIGALPGYINDKQVKELLEPFGELRAFKHIRDSITGLSKGYAFCEYKDASVTDQAVDGLNWLQLGDRKLIVQRASLGAKRVEKAVESVPDPVETLSPTEVLCLHNVVTPDELLEVNNGKDILEDIKKECEKHGVVRSVEMPLPVEGADVPGCGKIFILFDSAFNCQKAREELVKQNFNGRVITTSYFDPDKYNMREF
ncbi:hypothetical protein KR200_003801, partial [Drosophila serrata]